MLSLPGKPDAAAGPGISRSYAEGQDMEYKVFSGSFKPESLEREINRLAAEGWRVVSAFQAISLNDSGRGEVGYRSCCAGFRRWCLVRIFPAGRGAARCARGGTGSDCAGVASFPGRGDGVAGQAGSGRAQSRCQQARNASFQGQVRLIFSTRARAWRTRRAGSAHNR